MQRLWVQLIGDLHREQSVKQHEERKGKLDLESLLLHYPDFVEAEKKGNYKNLPIFSRYRLEPQTDTLPERIDVSFVIDNSGSMNATKLDAARKALTVTLLSLEDFNNYLTHNAEKLKQTVEVRSETWFFGSDFVNIKPLVETSAEEKQSGMIRSIVTLDATGGATDDGSCLQAIADGITPEEAVALQRGQRVKIVFEITDGASSFPGVAKKALSNLLEQKVEVYAFQIGETSPAEEKTFDYVWNDGLARPRGLRIGKAVETLPIQLLQAVEHNMQSVFRGRS